MEEEVKDEEEVKAEGGGKRAGGAEGRVRWQRGGQREELYQEEG